MFTKRNQTYRLVKTLMTRDTILLVLSSLNVENLIAKLNEPDLKTGKASGLDNIYAEFLKYAENFVVPFLTKLFNKLYDTSYFPLDWCKSVIIPLFKKGEDSNPDNYRGISLLSIVSKVFTAILNKRLYAWAENEGKSAKNKQVFVKATQPSITSLRNYYGEI